jgi:hypothetical protein
MSQMNLLDTLLGLFKSYGYWIVFFGVMLENAGLPLPGETILLAAGFFASEGDFSMPLVMLIATAGAVLGDNCGYWIGHRVGRGVLIKYGRYVMLTETRFQSQWKSISPRTAIRPCWWRASSPAFASSRRCLPARRTYALADILHLQRARRRLVGGGDDAARLLLRQELGPA